MMSTPDQVPNHMQAEFAEMSRLDDDALLGIVDSMMAQSDQQRLLDLSGRDGLTDAEREENATLRELYGRLTLRKATALALLSDRRGQTLLQRPPTT